MAAHGRRLRGFFRRPRPLLSRGWEECLGRRRQRCDGGQRRLGLRRLPRREDLEQALLGGDEVDAAVTAGAEQDEGRGDAWATIVADGSVMMPSTSPDACPIPWACICIRKLLLALNQSVTAAHVLDRVLWTFCTNLSICKACLWLAVTVVFYNEIL